MTDMLILSLQKKESFIKYDGFVESPIYCVAAVFQTLGILHVLPRS